MSTPLQIGILSRSAQLYSTRSLYQAGRRLGHSMYVIDHTQCTLLLESGGPTIMYRGRSLGFLDAVIPRIGASVTALGAAVISQFEIMEKVTPTRSDALLRARDKLRCLQQLAAAGLPVPRTAMFSAGQPIGPVLKNLGGFPVVVKLLESTHGIGVALAETPAMLKAILEAFLRLNERVLLQQYIAEAGGADVRVLVIDGEIVAAMRRQAQPGEFRSNLHRGATAAAVELSIEESELVSQVVSLMQLDVAGIDLIPSQHGPLVMEVNASPGLEGIENVTGVDVAGHIIKMIERKVNDSRTARFIKSGSSDKAGGSDEPGSS